MLQAHLSERRVHPSGGLGKADDVSAEKLRRVKAERAGDLGKFFFTYLAGMISKLLRAVGRSADFEHVSEGIAALLKRRHFCQCLILATKTLISLVVW